ncbi:MAG: diguanylate cyclase [Clostridiales bacterium]|nr:diguanylate cyclase [Clostridiales bacterium]
MAKQLFQDFFMLSPTAASYHRIIPDAHGVPCDYEFTSINKTYSDLTGAKAEDLVGKTFKELSAENKLPGGSRWFTALQESITEQKNISLDMFDPILEKWLRISIFPIDTLHFGTILLDVSREYSLEAEQERKSNFDRLFENNPAPMVISFNERIVAVNRAFTTITGYSHEEAIGKTRLETGYFDDDDSYRQLLRDIREKRSLTSREVRLRRKNGDYVMGLLSGEAIRFDGKDCILTVMVDITELVNERSKSESLEYALGIKEALLDLMKLPSQNVDEFLDRTLEQVILFTGSKIGYIFFYDEAREEFNLHSWSKNVLAECRVEDQTRLYQLSDVGLWGEVIRRRSPVIINDYTSAEVNKKGTPKDHLEIARFLSIPVFFNDGIVAVAGVANKAADYNNEDVLNLQLIMNTVWSSIEKLKTETSLIERIKELSCLHEVSRLTEDPAISRDQLYCGISAAISNAMSASSFAETTVTIDENSCSSNPSASVSGPGITSSIVIDGQVAGHIRVSYPDTAEFDLPFEQNLIDNVAQVIGLWLRRKAAEELLEDEREFFSTTLLSIDEAIVVSDVSGKITLMNKIAEDYCGCKKETVYGKDFDEIFNIINFITREKDPNPVKIVLSTGLNTKSPENLVMLKQDGSEMFVSGTASKILDSKGEIKGVVLAFRDISDMKALEESLMRYAVRDELTGLYNRHFLDTIISGHMERADRYNEALSIVLLDLDHFKRVNDSWGHPVGDDLLRHTARVIEKNIRASDIAIRFGGEEFVILMPQTGIEGAYDAAEKIREALEKTNHLVTGKQTASLGVAERMKSESFRSWYRRVDNAMYLAKQQGRNRVIQSTESDSLTVSPIHLEWRIEWESGISSIDRQHMELIEIANALLSMTFTSADKASLSLLLDRLLNCISSHFTDEEKVMHDIGYPSLEQHSLAHRKLSSKALRLKASYNNGEIRPSAFFSFIVDDVILDHMIESDTAYFQYIKRTNPAGQ